METAKTLVPIIGHVVMSMPSNLHAITKEDPVMQITLGKFLIQEKRLPKPKVSHGQVTLSAVRPTDDKPVYSWMLACSNPSNRPPKLF